MGDFGSYKEEIISTVEKIKHTVRIRLNEPAASVRLSLKNVPSAAIVTRITDESETDWYGEIVFEEERYIK